MPERTIRLLAVVHDALGRLRRGWRPSGAPSRFRGVAGERPKTFSEAGGLGEHKLGGLLSTTLSLRAETEFSVGRFSQRGRRVPGRRGFAAGATDPSANSSLRLTTPAAAGGTKGIVENLSEESFAKAMGLCSGHLTHPTPTPFPCTVFATDVQVQQSSSGSDSSIRRLRDAPDVRIAARGSLGLRNDSPTFGKQGKPALHCFDSLLQCPYTPVSFRATPPGATPQLSVFS